MESRLQDVSGVRTRPATKSAVHVARSPQVDLGRVIEPLPHATPNLGMPELALSKFGDWSFEPGVCVERRGADATISPTHPPGYRPPTHPPPNQPNQPRKVQTEVSSPLPSQPPTSTSTHPVSPQQVGASDSPYILHAAGQLAAGQREGICHDLGCKSNMVLVCWVDWSTPVCTYLGVVRRISSWLVGQ